MLSNNVPIRYKKKIYCSNCGKVGHPYKHCNNPITSFGVMDILITTDNKKIVDGIVERLSINVDKEGISSKGTISVATNGIKYSNPSDIMTFCVYKDNIKFLMIRRKNSLGYLEFIRGRYDVENVDGIIFLFKQMTSDEIKSIGIKSFDELWGRCWNTGKKKTCHQTEYNESKKKFMKLKEGSEDNNKILSLDFFVKNVTPTWDHAEWGFPKGRRNYHESDIMCALREFQEESGFVDGEYTILDKIAPLYENLIGTNGVSYRHIYYPALSTTNRVPIVEKQDNEIGDIGWFTYDQAMKLIRPFHTERLKLLTEMYMYMMNTISSLSRAE